MKQKALLQLAGLAAMLLSLNGIQEIPPQLGGAIAIATSLSILGRGGKGFWYVVAIVLGILGAVIIIPVMMMLWMQIDFLRIGIFLLGLFFSGYAAWK